MTRHPDSDILASCSGRPEGLVTIITPTYNRAHLLGRLRDSLRAQTDTAFTWLVVDDGSTDGTVDLLRQWAAESTPYAFSWVTQENGGKHRALNTAFERLTTPYYFVVDSDDWLPSGAMATIRGWLTPPILDPLVAGVAGLRLYPDGSPIGGYPDVPAGKDYVECTNLERRRHRLTGDKAEIYRSELARRYPYLTFPGERFLEEAVVGDAMAADGLRMRWYPQGIYLCEYQPDGLSATIDRHHAQSFEGYTQYVRQAVLLHDRRETWALTGVYADTARQRGLSYREAARRISRPVLVVSALGSVRRLVRGFRTRRG